MQALLNTHCQCLTTLHVGRKACVGSTLKISACSAYKDSFEVELFAVHDPLRGVLPAIWMRRSLNLGMCYVAGVLKTGHNRLAQPQAESLAVSTGS
jgi:hypothetical protein